MLINGLGLAEVDARLVSGVFLGDLTVKVEVVMGGNSSTFRTGKGVIVEKPGGSVSSLPLVIPKKLCVLLQGRISMLDNQVIGCSKSSSGIGARVREFTGYLGSFKKGSWVFVFLEGAEGCFYLGYQVIDNKVLVFKVLGRQGAASKVLPADMEAKTKAELNKKAHSSVILRLGNKVLIEVTGETTAVEVKFEDEDLALLLLTSLPASYEHFLATLLYGREALTLEDVMATLNSKVIKESPKAKGDDGEGLYVRGRTDRRDSCQSRGKSRSKSRGGRLKCYICQSEDHWIAVIMEYLVKISKKAHILELKQRHLKITVLTSNTPYPSRKIRRICACTSLKTTKKQDPIRHIQKRPIRRIQDMEINILENIERGPYSKKPSIRRIDLSQYASIFRREEEHKRYGYVKNHKKTVKNGQTRIQERKSVQEPIASLVGPAGDPWDQRVRSQLIGKDLASELLVYELPLSRNRLTKKGIKMAEPNEYNFVTRKNFLSDDDEGRMV
ncbi:hypothetical protein Tco_0838580 [Tanacetum coccineum]|uniref:Uncharacterized protein n=1 Tax=Tanacetum coccineum TaxID=301880 RepID=A0ABQ5AP40_9ASTR